MAYFIAQFLSVFSIMGRRYSNRQGHMGMDQEIES